MMVRSFETKLVLSTCLPRQADGTPHASVLKYYQLKTDLTVFPLSDLNGSTTVE